MAIIVVNRDPSRRDLFIFGCILPVVAGVVGLVLRGQGMDTGAMIVWVVGAVLLALYVVAPRLRRLIYLGWIYAFFPIGWVLSHIVLAVIYYLVLTPIGLLMRMAGKDPMTRRLDPSATTYWIERTGPVEPSRYLRQF